MWQPFTLARHAIHTIASELGRAVIIVVLLAGTFGGIIFADLDLAHQLRWEQQQRITNGLNVVIASFPGAIDAGICESLASHAGFRHSGSLREGKTQLLTSDRHTLIPTGTASVGLAQLWGYAPLSSLNEPGVLVGAALSYDQTILPGSYLDRVSQTPHKILGIVLETPRTAQIAGWMITVETANGKADQCWAETEPGLRATGEAVMRSLFPDDTQLTTLTNLDEYSADLEAKYQSRLALTIRWPLVLTLLLISALIVFTRRSEYGLYRALNMRAAHIAFTTQIEWATYVLIAAATGFCTATIATFFRWTQRSDVSLLWGIDTALADVTPLMATAMIAAPLMATLWHPNTANALKDR